MDIFAHMLWTNAVFYKKLQKERRERFLAVLFGVLPDLVSFTPLFLFSFFSAGGFFGMISRGGPVARYASESYNYTHSAVFFALAVLLIYLYRRRRGLSAFYWPMWGWLLHILIDIPSHKGFYETPFLFPLSSYRFEHGVSWGHPIFMLINYSALATVYLFWFLVLRRQRPVTP